MIKKLLLYGLISVSLQAQELTDLPGDIQEHHHANKRYLAQVVDVDCVYRYTRYVNSAPSRRKEFILAVAYNRHLINPRQNNLFAILNRLASQSTQ